METTKQEIESEQRAERRKVKEDAELLEGLMKHPGWARYLALIEANAQVHHKKAMMPLENLMLATASEYAKGTLYGLTLAASLPSAKIQEAAELRQPDDEG